MGSVGVGSGTYGAATACVPSTDRHDRILAALPRRAAVRFPRTDPLPVAIWFAADLTLTAAIVSAALSSIGWTTTARDFRYAPFATTFRS